MSPRLSSWYQRGCGLLSNMASNLWGERRHSFWIFRAVWSKRQVSEFFSRSTVLTRPTNLLATTWNPLWYSVLIVGHTTIQPTRKRRRGEALRDHSKKNCESDYILFSFLVINLVLRLVNNSLQCTTTSDHVINLLHKWMKSSRLIFQKGC